MKLEMRRKNSSEMHLLRCISDLVVDFCIEVTRSVNLVQLKLSKQGKLQIWGSVKSSSSARPRNWTLFLGNAAGFTEPVKGESYRHRHYAFLWPAATHRPTCNELWSRCMKWWASYHHVPSSCPRMVTKNTGPNCPRLWGHLQKRVYQKAGDFGRFEEEHTMRDSCT